MHKNKKENMMVPMLRFPGFVDDWEERKLGELGKATSGTSIESEFTDNGKYRIISIGSYSEQSVYTDQGIRTNLTDKSKNRILNKDDLTMVLNDKTASGNIIGRVLRIENSDSYVYNQRTQRIEPFHDKYDSQFLYQMLNAPLIRAKIIKQSQGNTQIYVNWTAIKELNYIIPSIKEQQHIGVFSAQIDDSITLHQRKLDHFQDLKKALLQQMFPKNGESVPQLRFPGFSEKWKMRKLGDIGDLKNGMNFGKEAMGKGYAFVNLQNIFGKNVVDNKDLGLAESTDKQRQEFGLKKGDVLFIRSSVKREGVGEAALIPNDFQDTTYSGFIIRFRPNLNMDNNYKKYVFSTNNVRNQIMARATSSANTNINQESLEKIIVDIPIIEEQAKIGSFFTQFDKTINLHQRKLIHLKDRKKALLQQLFI